MMKRFIAICIGLFIMLTGNVQPTFAMNIHVVVDKCSLFFPDQMPYIDSNNSVLVPARIVSEGLGGDVQWDPENGQVVITYEGDKILLRVNSTQAIIRSGSIERRVDMGTAAVLNNNRVMVPIRFVAEAMGCSVQWQDSTRTVSIERPIHRMPDQKLLEEINRLDTQIGATLSKKDGYQSLKSWDTNGVSLKSSGQFTDHVTSLSIDDLGDSFYFEYDLTGHNNIAWASIYFSTDSAQRNFFFYDISSEILQNKNHVIINREQFQVGAGSPKWDNIRYFRIAFQSKSGTELTISPKELATFNEGQGMVTLWFDDGWENSYSNAYRITSKVDPTIRGVIPIIPMAIGTERYLSKEQLTLLKNAGWEIVNHSYSHPYLNELSAEEIQDQIQRSFSFISQYDPIGAYHFAVPFSAVDERVLAVLKENVLSIRYLGETVDPVLFDRHKIGYKEVTNTTDFETVRGWIDEAIEQKQWLGLMFHRIEDPTDDRYVYGTQDFEKIIYYLSFMKEHIKTVTVTEAFQEIGLPIPLIQQ